MKGVNMAVTREELVNIVNNAEVALENVKAALLSFDQQAENNVFDFMEDAELDVEDMLQQRAQADCEGSYKCGQDVYKQEFMVDGVVYIGTLKCEYNRHDKKYYYVDETDFSVSKKELVL
jgi:hypothetical protein